MAEDKNADGKITLCFIKNISHNFAPVERYLKKRDYNVVVETDIKNGLNAIISSDPQYVFLAWDHKNEGIRNLPRFIYQSSLAQIIPFIMSTQRDQIIQLESSGFENKLYPPLSGPAILRVISKFEKKNQTSDQVIKSKDSSQKKSDMIQVKSFFNDDSQDPGPEVKISQPEALSADDRKFAAQKIRSKLNLVMPTAERLSGFYLPKQIKTLSEKQKLNLEESYTKKTSSEIFDMVETYADLSNLKIQISDITEVYVLIVQSSDWCGYLVVASENHIDMDSAEAILTDWMKTFIDDQQNNDMDATSKVDTFFTKIKIPPINFSELCEYKSEFYKNIEFEGRKTYLGFFSFSPFDVMLDMHEEFDNYILPADFLTPNQKLTFDLQLYLPENKKFIRYLKPGSTLSSDQVQRLQNNSDAKVYSSIEYEHPLLSHKAEYNLKGLVESYFYMKESKQI